MSASALFANHGSHNHTGRMADVANPVVGIVTQRVQRTGSILEVICLDCCDGKTPGVIVYDGRDCGDELRAYGMPEHRALSCECCDATIGRDL